jgi:hypothetical protein
VHAAAHVRKPQEEVSVSRYRPAQIACMATAGAVTHRTGAQASALASVSAASGSLARPEAALPCLKVTAIGRGAALARDADGIA